MEATADLQCNLSVVQLSWPFEASGPCTTAALLCLLTRHADNNSRPLSASLEWNDFSQPTGNKRGVKRLIIPVATQKESTIEAHISHIYMLLREIQQGTIGNNEPLDELPWQDTYSLQVSLVAGNYVSKESNRDDLAFYDRSGSILAAVELAGVYKRMLDITLLVDDLVIAGTVQEQVNILLRCSLSATI
ncbi:hypothetical protein N7504_003664 [Penicillium tannophilum]|nr:hypothetical protein N7504_003664 [Penicillium tannophilum]